MEKKKISVIVPVYNVEQYIRKCVRSICRQSYKNLEIILVNDGSKDNSGIVCDELAQKDSRIKVIHKENGGLSSARNAGISIATGEYFSFIDSDDFIDEEMLCEMQKAMEEENKDIACCGRVVDVYGNHENIEYTLNKRKVYSKQAAIKQVLHLSEIDVSACDKLYRRGLFDNLRYPEGKISEDAAIIFELLNISNGVVHVGKPFYHYVFRKKSISKSRYSIKNYDVIENLDKTKKFINKYYSEIRADFGIYSCITVSAQILSIYSDKEALKKYRYHLEKYMFYFLKGYRNAIKANDLSKKMKFRLFTIKHHLIWFYFLTKKFYRR